MPGTIATIVILSLLLAQAFVAVVLRFYVKIAIRKHAPNLSDYLVVVAWLMSGGWLLTVWVALSTTDSEDPEVQITSMKYMFASYYCFELGLYFPKASLLAFYWSLFPMSSTDLRMGLNIAISFFVAAFSTAVLLLSLWTRPISNNWSLTDNSNAIWADDVWIPFYVLYSMNISTDILVFCLPFLIFRRLRMTPLEKYNLTAIFSLGVVTIAVSITRFIWDFLDLDIYSSVLLCTAEFTVAITVVSLPHMKHLIKNNSASSTQLTLTPTRTPLSDDKTTFACEAN